MMTRFFLAVTLIVLNRSTSLPEFDETEYDFMPDLDSPAIITTTPVPDDDAPDDSPSELEPLLGVKPTPTTSNFAALRTAECLQQHHDPPTCILPTNTASIAMLGIGLMAVGLILSSRNT